MKREHRLTDIDRAWLFRAERLERERSERRARLEAAAIALAQAAKNRRLQDAERNQRLLESQKPASPPR
jgi:hypothetical protein